MGLFHNVKPKELLDLRNKIVLNTAIPALLKSGFSKSPFSGPSYGRNNLNDFSYDLCRLTSNSQLEFIDIYVCRGDRWIKFNLNIFQLSPSANSIEQLNGIDGIQFKLMPNTLTQLQLRVDTIKGAPLFSLRYMCGHKLKRSYTRYGLDRNLKNLTKTIEADLHQIDYFVKRWHALHKPLTTNWTGQPIDAGATSL